MSPGSNHVPELSKSLATGTLRIVPQIPGKEHNHVFDGEELRGLLFGTDPRAAAKVKLLYLLMPGVARTTQMLRSIKLLCMMSRI